MSGAHEIGDADELEAARRAAIPYLEPESLRDPEGRRRREQDPTPLTESYATQVYVHGARLLRPITTVGDAGEPDLDAGGVRWVLTGWNANGKRSSLRRQQRAQSVLRAEIVLAGGRVVGEGVTAAPDRRWVEDHLLVAGLDADDAVQLGRAAGQAAVVAVAGDVVVVVPTGLRDDVERLTRAVVAEPLPTTCPMRTDGVPGAQCVMRGGPWISASIHAAVIWRAHRALLLERFGCIPCGSGTVPLLGPFAHPDGAISLGELTLPSRYGGWAWTR